MKKSVMVLLFCLIPMVAQGVQSKERLEAFDSVERHGVNGKYYAGVAQAGEKLTIRVTDKWHQLSEQRKKDFMKQSLSLFFGMGGARGFKETSGTFVVTFVEKSSGKTVASWNGLTGPSISK